MKIFFLNAGKCESLVVENRGVYTTLVNKFLSLEYPDGTDRGHDKSGHDAENSVIGRQPSRDDTIFKLADSGDDTPYRIWNR